MKALSLSIEQNERQYRCCSQRINRLVGIVAGKVLTEPAQETQRECRA